MTNSKQRRGCRLSTRPTQRQTSAGLPRRTAARLAADRARRLRRLAGLHVRGARQRGARPQRLGACAGPGGRRGRGREPVRAGGRAEAAAWLQACCRLGGGTGARPSCGARRAAWAVLAHAGARTGRRGPCVRRPALPGAAALALSCPGGRSCAWLHIPQRRGLSGRATARLQAARAADVLAASQSVAAIAQARPTGRAAACVRAATACGGRGRGGCDARVAARRRAGEQGQPPGAAAPEAPAGRARKVGAAHARRRRRVQFAVQPAQQRAPGDHLRPARGCVWAVGEGALSPGEQPGLSASPVESSKSS